MCSTSEFWVVATTSSAGMRFECDGDLAEAMPIQNEALAALVTAIVDGAGMKLECEGDLAEAMPILNEALAALDTIKDADIQYIKKLGNPPALIKLVMEVRHRPNISCSITSSDPIHSKPARNLQPSLSAAHC